MTIEERNETAGQEMTDEVGELVLDDNRSQTLTLAIARRQALPMVNVHARYLHVLESEGWLNRTLECLPTDKQIAERQSSGMGLTTPEFAIVHGVHQERQHGARWRAPTSPTTRTSSPISFATSRRCCRSGTRPEILEPSASSRDHRHADRQSDGQSVGHLVRQSNDRRHRRGRRRRDAGVGRGARHLQLPGDVGTDRGPADARQARHATGHVPRGASHGRARRPVAAASSPATDRDRFGRGRVPARYQRVVDNAWRHTCAAGCATRCSPTRRRGSPAGFPSNLRSARSLWPLMHTSFDVIDLAHRQDLTVRETTAAYWQVFDALDLGWLWDAVGMLPRNDRWQTQARSALRDDLMGALADLANDALSVGGAREWAAANERVVGRATVDVHRDPPRRCLRPHDAVGRLASIAQPDPDHPTPPLPPDHRRARGGGSCAPGSNGSAGRVDDA